MPKVILFFAPTHRDFKVHLEANRAALPTGRAPKAIFREEQLAGLSADTVEAVVVVRDGGPAYLSPRAQMLFAQGKALGLVWAKSYQAPKDDAMTIVFADNAQQYNEWVNAQPHPNHCLYVGEDPRVLKTLPGHRFDRCVTLGNGGPLWDTTERISFFIRAGKAGKRWAMRVAFPRDDIVRQLLTIEAGLRHPIELDP